jgi:hypothetical protein
MRLLWNDSRLVYTGNTENETFMLDSSRIWTPDAFFYNEQAYLAVLDETCSLRVPSAGTVFWNRVKNAPLL